MDYYEEDDSAAQYWQQLGQQEQEAQEMDYEIWTEGENK